MQKIQFDSRRAGALCALAGWIALTAVLVQTADRWSVQSAQQDLRFQNVQNSTENLNDPTIIARIKSGQMTEAEQRQLNADFDASNRQLNMLSDAIIWHMQQEWNFAGSLGSGWF